MARLPRTTLPRAVHHVVNRCNHQQHLFSDGDLQDCCALLLEAKQRFGVRVYAYAFLHNHYHLLIQEPTRQVLSVAMHWFNGTAATRYNTRHDLRGHLWQGRFKNRRIEGDRSFLQAMLYVDLNPARAGLAPKVTDWPFSSTSAHANGNADPLLDPPPFELSSYKDLLMTDWKRTQQLRLALENKDRSATKEWLRDCASRSFFPFKNEIRLLIGDHYRRFIPSESA